ncbi:glutamate-5-semialdehyde dehydrogenase [Ascoidea rubescens DSM 1968]|uniref:glutamate-5-semialdehyde dehydrogenase n=1 Tax=Ascoidea rubescens DSM 1968 TaxID=1344418 RepID=A0A1D2VHU1_9ASCO|nr:gamma-glutamyl phosphate reductase GPR [Ascoidea rubescens DSM 1968]ODV61218.1 gamma-glutamyl phosphate reductase GPR [Ascoidea rubescens DSM 1968]
MAEQIAREAHLASTVLKTLSDEERSNALHEIYDGLLQAKEDILKANLLDLQLATEQNLSPSLIKRLDLSKSDKFDSMLQGIKDVAALSNPIGKINLATQLDEGLNLYRVTCPVGVLLIIFESRPEVIANITALAIKSGNAAILKGGKESLNTFKILAKIVNTVLSNKTKVPKNSIQLISSRSQVSDLLDQDKYIDLVIPRGSNDLVRYIKSNTKIPVLGHADGICSIYIDQYADVEKSVKIVVDAKINYPAGCNAVESVLIHKDLLNSQLIPLANALIENKVTLHVTPEIKSFLIQNNTDLNYIKDANIDEDFSKEFLSLDIAIKSIDSLEDAIYHINTHSSKHTDAIITENESAANKFLGGIDSAGVYWNCSTRFADGFRYGFGTEVGISTNKIHARGPVGLEGLVCYQYQLRGNGHIVSDYIGSGGKKLFVHKQLDLDFI